jgi:hypothetical protein
MVSDALISMIVILTCIPVVFLKSICVRPAIPSSLYEISENGGDIAKLVKQVSTEVTSEFMISILSSGVGHSALLCEQDEWGSMAADYHTCVHQVQHQLRCGGHGGVCQWVQAFVDSCTGQVMGQCWTQPVIELLKKRQAEILANSHSMVEEKWENLLNNSGLIILVKHLKERNFLGREQNNFHSEKSLFSSKLLRLG